MAKQKEIHTIWKELKGNWIIKKSDIRDLGINPDKTWEDITLGELSILAGFLDVLVGDLV